MSILQALKTKASKIKLKWLGQGGLPQDFDLANVHISPDEETPGAFEAKVPLSITHKALNVRRVKVIQLAHIHPVTATEVEQHLGYEDSGAYTLLGTMVRRGLLKKVKSRGATHYHPTAKGLRLIGVKRVSVKQA